MRQWSKRKVEVKTMPKIENGSVKRIAVAVLIIVIAGWIAWVCDGIIIGKTERAAAAAERAYIGQNINEIKDGIKDLKQYFKVP